MITAYQTDVPFLQPGSRFSIAMQVTNLGNVDARRVSMILGGGSSSGGSSDGTPVVGGVSGAGGDFGDFAPVDSSNVQFLGDMAVEAQLSTNARLIVNASAEPGAYPLKITFAYSDEKGRIYNDDQVVTSAGLHPAQDRCQLLPPARPTVRRSARMLTSAGGQPGTQRHYPGKHEGHCPKGRNSATTSS